MQFVDDLYRQTQLTADDLSGLACPPQATAENLFSPAYLKVGRGFPGLTAPQFGQPVALFGGQCDPALIGIGSGLTMTDDVETHSGDPSEIGPASASAPTAEPLASRDGFQRRRAGNDIEMASPERSYIVCATPRSGSTLVCQALTDTGIAGRPEEYFEALRHSGQPRRPEEYFHGVEDRSILEHLGARSPEPSPTPRQPLWSDTAYDRYLDWVFATGTTPNGVFGSKMMWDYFGDFVSLLRNLPEYRDLPLADLLPAVFPNLTYVRVIRANKVRQAVSLWKAVQTATWRTDEKDPGTAITSLPENADTPAYRSYVDEHRPPLRFHYGAIAHLLKRTIQHEAAWDAFFEHVRIKPVLVLYENFAADYTDSTINVLDRLGLETPQGLEIKPRMKSQSDGVNDNWARRYSELRLGTEFDLVPAVPDVPDHASDHT